MRQRKYVIELNGVSNIQMLLTLETDKVVEPTGEKMFYMNEETYVSLLNEVKILTEYMRAYADAVNTESSPPEWFEIKNKLKQKDN